MHSGAEGRPLRQPQNQPRKGGYGIDSVAVHKYTNRFACNGFR